MKQILMIHDMREEYLSLPLDKYILTFDDCLYSVYKYKQQLCSITTKKYLAIPTERILKIRKNTISDISTFDANALWLLYKDNSAYMTIDEVLEMQTLNFELAGHGHCHSKIWKTINKQSKITQMLFFKKDIQKMMQWFKQHTLLPTTYVFPYNVSNSILVNMLKKEGFNQFFGNSRRSIENVYKEKINEN